MANAQFNTRLVNILKDILLRLRHDDSPETIQKDFDQNFKHISDVEILLIIQELKSGEHGITSQDVMKSFNVFTQIYSRSITEDRKSTRLNSSHVAISYAVFCL